jgi:hypothetical protein
MVCNTPPYGHAPTYQISLTYLERQKRYGSDKLHWEEAEEAEEEEEAEAEEKIRLNQYVSLRSKGRHNYVWKRDTHMWRGVFDTNFKDKICHLLEEGQLLPLSPQIQLTTREYL